QWPFLLCLRCGAAFDRTERNEFKKLSRLSNAGRSTATTVVSGSAIVQLREDRQVQPEAKKLLSFTDNRQDASLQAGHFNDFIQIGLLRGALYAAVERAAETGLSHESIAREVVAALGLDFPEYSSNPDARFLVREKIDKALRDVIGYRIYRDLRRGWRVTSPNLEQCGLLRVRYDAMEEVCAADDVWQSHPILAAAKPAERLRVCQTVLDTMRRE